MPRLITALDIIRNPATYTTADGWTLNGGAWQPSAINKFTEGGKPLSTVFDESMTGGLSTGYGLAPMLGLFQRPLFAKSDAGPIKVLSDVYHATGMAGTIGVLSASEAAIHQGIKSFAPGMIEDIRAQVTKENPNVSNGRIEELVEEKIASMAQKGSFGSLFFLASPRPETMPAALALGAEERGPRISPTSNDNNPRPANSNEPGTIEMFARTGNGGSLDDLSQPEMAVFHDNNSQRFADSGELVPIEGGNARMVPVSSDELSDLGIVGGVGTTSIAPDGTRGETLVLYDKADPQTYEHELDEANYHGLLALSNT